jgi:hypothetical protein
MSMLGQGLTGLALALSFVPLGTNQVRTAAIGCAAQAVVVACAAAALNLPWIAAVELAVAVAIAWAAPILPPAPTASRPSTILTGGALALLAVMLPGQSVALAVAAVGAVIVATRRSAFRQVLGLTVVQNSVLLAAMGGGRVIPVLPLVPALAAAGLWLAGQRPAVLRRWPRGNWIDAAGCGVIMVLSLTLLWQVPLQEPPLHVDALGAAAIAWLATVAVAAGWGDRLHAASAPPAGTRLVLLLAAALAIALQPMRLSWLALAIAVAAAAAMSLPLPGEAWRRLRLGCLGLGVALFGLTALPGGGGWAPACIVAGLGTLAWLAPELALTAAVLIVRQREAASAHTLLLLAGLAAMAIGGCGLMLRGDSDRWLEMAGFGQAGAAVFAWGVGTPEAHVAAVLHLSMLALTQSAVRLARAGGIDRVAALAGLAGVPPFGMFSSLAMIVAATAARSAWLVLPLVGGLGVLGWPILSRLPRNSVPPPLEGGGQGEGSVQPPDLGSTHPSPYPRPTGAGGTPGYARSRFIRGGPADTRRWQLAWIPLILLLIAGFAMPHPVFAWLRAAAVGVP